MDRGDLVLFVSLLVVLLWVVWQERWCRPGAEAEKGSKPKGQRQLRPRTPKSCYLHDLRRQACGKRVSERRGTALYRLKTASWRVSEVLAALAEGLDVGAAVRVCGHAEGTILRWRRRAGMHAERMHEQFFHSLQLWHIQLDELKTRLREKGHEVWVWVALNVKTKVIPSLAIGPRT